ncbi:MAG TPA: outer membrane protein assembly factor BamA [Steroidobacteraceae bacterium]
MLASVALFVHAALSHAQGQAADEGPVRAPTAPQGPLPAPAPAAPQGPTPAPTQVGPAATPALPAPTATPAVTPALPAPTAAAPAPAPTAPGPAAPPSESDFTVGDIRVEGLQRVSEGTVYNYLPVNIGDHLNAQRVREAIRALYATGFFRDVQLRREGNSLVVVVAERPSIESFEITGNKDIKTEELQKSLRNVGLATGKTFDRSVLDEVTGYLTDQYFSRGKYGVKVDTNVEEESGNRVKIKIEIKEGKRAKIRQINIVGNTKFKEKDILDTFELKTPNWLSWYKSDDRYSRESLQGDLEKLRNYYMDRGYANFEIESTQVTIAPEKEDMFITVNVTEGDVFKLSSVKLAGTFVVPEADLERLVLVHPGEQFDRKMITSTQELIQNRLGVDGYAFAKVDPVPTPNNETHEVSLTFFIDPGNRVYVRDITFSGTNRINDIVLRREMRQLEGEWLANTALERSKQRLQRLPYVKNVDFETTPVPGSPDLVDVNFKIEEGPAAQLSGGIGYSEAYGAMLNGQYIDANWMGTGQRVAVDLNGGAYSKVYNISHTNPYTSVDGVSRTESLTYSDVTQFVSSSSDFSSKQYSFGLTWAYPISEFQFLRFGGTLSDSNLLTSSLGSAIQAQEWVIENGKPSSRVGHDDSSNADYLFYGTSFKTAELALGWDFDTRNRTLFADHGMHTSLNASATVPGSDVEYWVGNASFQKYVPLWKQWTLSFYDSVDYGAPLGKTTALPPYRNFFSGGPDSIRGYRESRLGPKDQFGNPYGGNLRITSRNELIFPMPKKWAQSARVSAFFDIGNVFSSDHVQFYGIDGVTPVNYKFSYGNLKRSAGIAVEWLAPLGLFRFSYGIPLNAQKQDAVNWGDETEGFQFSIGQAF